MAIGTGRGSHGVAWFQAGGFKLRDKARRDVDGSMGRRAVVDSILHDDRSSR